MLVRLATATISSSWADRRPIDDSGQAPLSPPLLIYLPDDERMKTKFVDMSRSKETFDLRPIFLDDVFGS
jgi:hypothetical protein